MTRTATRPTVRQPKPFRIAWNVTFPERTRAEAVASGVGAAFGSVIANAFDARDARNYGRQLARRALGSIGPKDRVAVTVSPVVPA